MSGNKKALNINKINKIETTIRPKRERMGKCRENEMEIERKDQGEGRFLAFNASMVNL